MSERNYGENYGDTCNNPHTSWLNTGLQASVVARDAGSDAVRSEARYGYDEAGRRTAERFWRDGVGYQDATARYDALGRMTAGSEAGSALTPAASMAWSDDAVGNIRRTVASRASLDWQGAITTPTSEERWFGYDARGRVVRGDGRETVHDAAGVFRGAGSHPDAAAHPGYSCGWQSGVAGVGRAGAVWNRAVP